MFRMARSVRLLLLLAPLILLAAMACAPAAAPTPTPAKPAAPAPAAPKAEAPAPAKPALPEKPAAKPEAADVEKAKAEGKVVVYTGNRSEVAEAQAKAFEKRYGIKVEWIRQGTQQTKERVYAELRAGKVQADIAHVVDVAFFEDLRKKGALAPFRTPYFDKIPAALKEPNGHWLANRVVLVLMAYNPDRLKTAPTGWLDLVDPQYKGKIMVGDANYGGLPVAWANAVSKALGWEYFEKIGKNEPLLFQANTQGVQWLSTGERLLGTTTDYDAATAIAKGEPVKLVYPKEGAVPVPGVTGVLKDAPHPNAGRLFAEWLLSDEGQKTYLEGGQNGARVDAPPPPGGKALSEVKLLAVDWVEVEEKGGEIKERYMQLVSRK